MHHPYKRTGTLYFQYSIDMSVGLSLSRAHLEMANVEFASVLRQEFLTAEGEGSIREAVKCLELSHRALGEMNDAIVTLRRELKAEGFRDLHTVPAPPDPVINPRDLAEVLSGHGLADPYEMADVALTLNNGGLDRVLEEFSVKIEKNRQQTSALAAKFGALSKAEGRGDVIDVIELNMTGNVSRDIAQLYCSANALQAHFWASSVISNELWYKVSRIGSLLYYARTKESVN